MKRIIAILLSVAMLVCYMPAMAFAEEEIVGTKENPATYVRGEDHELGDQYENDVMLNGVKGTAWYMIEVPEDNLLYELCLYDSDPEYEGGDPSLYDKYAEVTVYKNDTKIKDFVLREDNDGLYASEIEANRGDKIYVKASLKDSEGDLGYTWLLVNDSRNYGVGTSTSPYELFQDEDGFYTLDGDCNVYTSGKDELWYSLTADDNCEINFEICDYSDGVGITGGEVYVGGTDAANKIADMSIIPPEYDDESPQIRAPYVVVKKGETVYFRVGIDNEVIDRSSAESVWVSCDEYRGAGTVSDPYILVYDDEEDYVGMMKSIPAVKPGDYYFKYECTEDKWLVFNASGSDNSSLRSVSFCDADGAETTAFRCADSDWGYYVGDVHVKAGDVVYIKVSVANSLDEGDLYVGGSENELFWGMDYDKFSYTYTGKAIKPSIYVMDLTYNELVPGTDYTITYYNNTKVGRAKAVITPLGKYAELGKQTAYYNITPKKASIKSVTAGSKKLTVKASTKVSSTAGTMYQIGYKQKGTSKWKYTTTSSQSKIIKSLKKGKQYYVKIRAYKTVNSTKYYGPWSSTKLSKKIK